MRRRGEEAGRAGTCTRWRPHKVYQPPIFDRLQSSYDDVRHELNVLRFDEHAGADLEPAEGARDDGAH